MDRQPSLERHAAVCACLRTHLDSVDCPTERRRCADSFLATVAAREPLPYLLIQLHHGALDAHITTTCFARLENQYIVQSCGQSHVRADGGRKQQLEGTREIPRAGRAVAYAPRSDMTCCARVGETWPKRLAEGAATGMSAALSNACACSCAGQRTPTAPLPAVTTDGRAATAGATCSARRQDVSFQTVKATTSFSA
eukprot:972114-Pleurochrysis_carterae.AAC.5